MLTLWCTPIWSVDGLPLRIWMMLRKQEIGVWKVHSGATRQYYIARSRGCIVQTKAAFVIYRSRYLDLQCMNMEHGGWTDVRLPWILCSGGDVEYPQIINCNMFYSHYLCWFIDIFVFIRYNLFFLSHPSLSQSIALFSMVIFSPDFNTHENLFYFCAFIFLPQTCRLMLVLKKRGWDMEDTGRILGIEREGEIISQLSCYYLFSGSVWLLWFQLKEVWI